MAEAIPHNSYKHYQGGTYTVDIIAVDAAGNKYVIYRKLGNPEYLCIPKVDWEATALNEEYETVEQFVNITHRNIQ